MEPWLEALISKFSYKIWCTPGADNPHVCPDMIDYEPFWYEEAVKVLLTYKGKSVSMFNDLFQRVFQLGSFRLTIYNSPQGWSDCRYRRIEFQKTEIDTMAEALYQTLLQRFNELWHRQDLAHIKRIDIRDWFYNELHKAGLTDYDIKEFTFFPIP